MQTYNKLIDLKCKIEFLQNSTDHDILVGSIERLLTEFTEFQCTFSKYSKAWDYYIRCEFQHSAAFNRKHSTKLDALYAAISDLTTDLTRK